MRAALLALVILALAVSVQRDAGRQHLEAFGRGAGPVRMQPDMTLAPDPELTAIAVALTGRPEVRAYCGGNDPGTWGEALIDDGQLWLDKPIVCNRLKRFLAGERPVAACLKFKRRPAKWFALAALVFRHEIRHLEGDADEAHTECVAIQRVPEMFAQLGEPNALYVDALMVYAWYWHVQETKIVDWLSGKRPYWSPDCKRDGAWDLTPGDGRWP